MVISRETLLLGSRLITTIKAYKCMTFYDLGSVGLKPAMKNKLMNEIIFVDITGQSNVGV